MVDVLKYVDKCYIYQLISTVQLPGSVIFDSQIKMHTGTKKDDVSLAKEYKEHLKNSTSKMVQLIKENKRSIDG